MWWILILAASTPYEEGLKLLNAGHWQQARQRFEQAVQSNPRDALAWKALGVVAGQGGDVADAEEAFRRGCEIAPRLEDVCYYHARSLYTLNRFGAAIAAMEKLRASESRQGRLWAALGQAYEANGDTTKAEAAFAQALRRADYQPEALLRYGVFLFRQGRPEEAEAQFRKALALAPQSTEAKAELGRMLYQRGELGAAIPYLEAGASQYPWAQQLLEKARRRLALTAQP